MCSITHQTLTQTSPLDPQSKANGQKTQTKEKCNSTIDIKEKNWTLGLVTGRISSFTNCVDVEYKLLTLASAFL